MDQIADQIEDEICDVEAGRLIVAITSPNRSKIAEALKYHKFRVVKTFVNGNTGHKLKVWMRVTT